MVDETRLVGTLSDWRAIRFLRWIQRAVRRDILLEFVRGANWRERWSEWNRLFTDWTFPSPAAIQKRVDWQCSLCGGTVHFGMGREILPKFLCGISSDTVWLAEGLSQEDRCPQCLTVAKERDLHGASFDARNCAANATSLTDNPGCRLRRPPAPKPLRLRPVLGCQRLCIMASPKANNAFW